MNSTPHIKSTATEFTFEGSRITLYGSSEDEYIFSKILNHSTFYEQTFLKYLRFCVRKSGCFIDAGANIGNHSIFFSKIMARKCISFEPNPKAYALLKKNIVANNSTAVAYELGLSNTTSRARIRQDGSCSKNLGATTLVQDTGAEDAILMRSLDGLLNEKHLNQKVAAIKVDVEGFEDKVLAGSVNTIVRDRPSVFVEAIDSPAYEAVNSVLEPIGYKEIYSLGGTPMYHFVHRTAYTEILRSRIWQTAFKVGKWLRTMR
ncbi:FkbM family methyltransferase [Sulfitobacter sp. 1A12126]|uniref:FkbM family methyltransferase n=1 Tax=Sulfitobacter sp. 1A12126 TaxID=3368591 RepID=UPI003747647E